MNAKDETKYLLEDILEIKSNVLTLEKKLNDLINKIEEIVEQELELIKNFSDNLNKVNKIEELERKIDEIKELLSKKKIII